MTLLFIWLAIGLQGPESLEALTDSALSQESVKEDARARFRSHVEVSFSKVKISLPAPGTLRSHHLALLESIVSASPGEWIFLEQVISKHVADPVSISDESDKHEGISRPELVQVQFLYGRNLSRAFKSACNSEEEQIEADVDFGSLLTQCIVEMPKSRVTRISTPHVDGLMAISTIEFSINGDASKRLRKVVCETWICRINHEGKVLWVRQGSGERRER